MLIVPDNQISHGKGNRVLPEILGRELKSLQFIYFNNDEKIYSGEGSAVLKI